MSFFPGKDPAPGDARASDAIEQVIVPRSIDLGDFRVNRARCPRRGRAWWDRSFFSIMLDRPCFVPAVASTCGHIRISGWRP